MAKMHQIDWLFAIGTVFFILSLWGIGANDVANSYATSVSSKSLTLVQAGVLATFTEFIGAISLGQQVTSTIRSGVFSVTPFENSPGVLVLAMVVAEVGSATWLALCTWLGFPVSTTQSIVGALVGVGIASNISVNWGWKTGSVSQIAASWGIAPCIAAGFGAIIFMSIKVLVHDRKDPMKWALRVLPFYYALTAGILALFLVISGGHGIPTLDEMGAGQATGIILGVFGGVLIVAAVFFLPYYHAKLVKEDHRLRPWHIPMGPLLWRENYSLYLPGSANGDIPDYYASEFADGQDSGSSFRSEKVPSQVQSGEEESTIPKSGHLLPSENDTITAHDTPTDGHHHEAKAREFDAVNSLPWAHPKRILATIKLIFTYGITRDVVSHQSKGLESVHARAKQYENKVEHLWTTAQICTAMLMSIAHGANDVSNAIGPFTTEYATWSSGVTSTKTDTPTWIKAVGGLGLGFGFWTFGYHIMRNLGNRITKHTPTRGYSMELAAAVTVLLASRLGLPVSTTQCITGGIVGVALTNGDLKSINWKQLGKIFLGWVLTVPSAGLISGILMGMALNVPRWGPRP
ncbi:phosphate transporter [Calycina marina]|uniref:Phosphate transporter n=1 Tax=Calycina marina TaxID=1763456 RepID=A0A9P8CHE8_9HELO|nr:phosphate transporter [Calycina marina]